jgi:hypothetical protein
MLISLECRGIAAPGWGGLQPAHTPFSLRKYILSYGNPSPELRSYVTMKEKGYRPYRSPVSDSGVWKALDPLSLPRTQPNKLAPQLFVDTNHDHYVPVRGGSHLTVLFYNLRGI